VLFFICTLHANLLQPAAHLCRKLLLTLVGPPEVVAEIKATIEKIETWVKWPIRLGFRSGRQVGKYTLSEVFTQKICGRLSRGWYIRIHVENATINR
jgi:hypothetical protein